MGHQPPALPLLPCTHKAYHLDGYLTEAAHRCLKQVKHSSAHRWMHHSKQHKQNPSDLQYYQDNLIWAIQDNLFTSHMRNDHSLTISSYSYTVQSRGQQLNSRDLVRKIQQIEGVIRGPLLFTQHVTPTHLAHQSHSTNMLFLLCWQSGSCQRSVREAVHKSTD